MKAALPFIQQPIAKVIYVKYFNLQQTFPLGIKTADTGIQIWKSEAGNKIKSGGHFFNTPATIRP